VYGLIGQDNGINQFQILRITPSTNTSTVVADFESDFIIQSIDSFDPTSNWLWIQGVSNNDNVLLAFDITSGAVGYNQTDNLSLQNLNYDNAIQTVVGLSGPEDNFNNVIAWNGTSQSFSVYSAMHLGYSVVVTGPSNCGLSSSEGESGVLFCYVQSSSTYTDQFVAIDVQSGVATALPFDRSYSTLPVTIASFAYA